MDNTATFIERWQKADGSERANYQLFLTELCVLLGLPLPEPANKDTPDNAYVFERRVVIKQPDGSENNGFIDLYKRDCFVLEAKQSGKTLDSSGWDKAMLKAHNQADQYARALPSSEGRPPFIIVVDVGRNIELYAEFSRSGATYTAFPDSNTHRLRLEDLHTPEIRERLHTVWLDPLSLDPSRRAAKVTRKIADQLAQLAKSLEVKGHAAQDVAAFLMRCLFTMFAEDVGLIPNRSFTTVLEELQTTPDICADMLENLWQTMNTGGFSSIIKKKLLKFNGGLFADHRAIPLDKQQIALLLTAAKSDWQFVEPAIFGTLLERALNAKERHKLGAHYTPRAYVERLVLPTVIEPLRREWKEVQAAALTYEQQNKHKEAVEEVKKFHRYLCNIKVLDPACGTGNFLYVTLEHMKRLEGEILNVLQDLGQTGLLEMDGVTVDPHQFLGLEINPRAARIAEMVLWIGYLQWHYRTHGNVKPPEPVLRDFKNIENRDALISYERQEALLDNDGKPVTRWDGESYKTSPITGEKIPDESVQVQQYHYIGVKKAEWPQADYIVGNPPYIGARKIRYALGDDYLHALRTAYPDIPENADFVMYWWEKSAALLGESKTNSFGLITTNSLRQSFSRKVIDNAFAKYPSMGISFVVPDHPWVDSSDGAAVRVTLISTTHTNAGLLAKVVSEQPFGDDEINVNLATEQGFITSNLVIGADPTKAKILKSNQWLACVGYQISGKGFLLDASECAQLVAASSHTKKIIKPLLTGNDINQKPRSLMAIDLFGLSEADVRNQYSSIYQWLYDRVKPERDQNNRVSLRNRWWIFGEARSTFRPAILNLTTVAVCSLTSKHRFFVQVPATTICDSTTVMFAVSDSWQVGILASRLHIVWTLNSGGTLEDRPRYNKSVCFESFPFPLATPEQQAQIRHLAEQLDAHRKCQQAAHADLTLTGMYNILEKIRLGEPLNDKDKIIHQKGLVSILRELHDDLDRAVFEAYGWSDLADQLVGKAGATTPYPNKPDDHAAAEEELLKRLVDLNTQRTADEAKGTIHWLRPEYQNPTAIPKQTHTQGELETTSEENSDNTKPTAKQTWPKEMREQVSIVRQSVKDSPSKVDQIASRFKSKKNLVASVQSVLDALESLGMVSCADGVYR